MKSSSLTLRKSFNCLLSQRGTKCRACGFSSTALKLNELAIEPTNDVPRPPPIASKPELKSLDPSKVGWKSWDKRELKLGQRAVGSRRLRAAKSNVSNIRFEQLPYQCFQEARKILHEDRQEKLAQIAVERKRIEKATALDPSQCGGEAAKKGKLVAMHKYLERLKILADINDPMIKKRFEDGEGDLNRPIYRHLADQEWRKYRRLITLQRITQMNVVPDVLPNLDPTAEVTLGFGRRRVQPGDMVDSRVSETAPSLNVQVFEAGRKLVTVVVVDSDVPNLERDRFDYRCHFLAVNLPISPMQKSFDLRRLRKDQIILPWLPPYAQMGSPYHRLSTFILEQPEGKVLDHEAIRKKESQDDFNLRRFNDRHLVKPIGVHLFRTVWDDGTADVMHQAGIPGADVMLKRKKPEKLPYKKKDGARYR